MGSLAFIAEPSTSIDMPRPVSSSYG